MAIEIRILSGALRGQVKRFDKSPVVIGRQGDSDLRFDPEKDLDVSGRHAEIHAIQGRYALHDLHSTNGTMVNGMRLDAGASIEIKQGDRLRFGAKGPEADFQVVAAIQANVPSTEVRIAMAVNKQTAGLRRLMAAGLAIVVIGGGSALYYTNRDMARRDEELARLLATNDSMRVQLQGPLARSGDTTLMSNMQERMATLRARYDSADTDVARAQIRTEIHATEQQLRRMVQMDLPTIFARNKNAVAIMMTDFGPGKVFSGSAFGITREGLLVTNKHNVVDPETGTRARRLAVKFTDTRDWLPARIVRYSETDELALIQMERQGLYPVVEGVSGAGGESAEGMGVAIIGYPSGTDTPMEGTGNDFMAKSTLTTGTVSKNTSNVLQIDSFATHGSSGSPVFGGSGRVIGVVFGGDRNAGGRIVYAVPAQRLAEFIPEEYRAIIRD
ncbi:MAG: FHA domain-containing protein [Gemmatimonadaceae bacterium]